MKKLLLFGITVAMLLSLAACGGNDKPSVEGDKTDGKSTFEVGEPNREDVPSIIGDEADGNSDFKVGEPNWND